MSSAEVDRIFTILPEIGLTYKPTVKPSKLPVIGSSYECYQLLKHNWDEGKIELQEEFKVLLLNRSNRVIGTYPASCGGITGTVADPRLILLAAIKTAAVGIILSHNHPSGALNPSKADEDMTSKIKSAAAFLDIKVLDHIILTSESYYSFADEGIL